MSKQTKNVENGFLPEGFLSKIDNALQNIMMGPLTVIKTFFPFFFNKK